MATTSATRSRVQQEQGGKARARALRPPSEPIIRARKLCRILPASHHERIQADGTVKRVERSSTADSIGELSHSGGRLVCASAAPSWLWRVQNLKCTLPQGGRGSDTSLGGSGPPHVSGSVREDREGACRSARSARLRTQRGSCEAVAGVIAGSPGAPREDARTLSGGWAVRVRARSLPRAAERQGLRGV